MSFPAKPVLKDLFHQHSDVSLDFIVVGGSIGGLACAYNLKQAGHNVHVLERSRGPGNVCTGMAVPPNMTKIFRQWGLGDRLERTAVQCPYIDLLDGVDGGFISSLVFYEDVMKELQAQQYMLPYSEVYWMVYDIAAASGIQVVYNAEVVDVNVDEPSILLASGERLRADLIVGADGVTSIVREKLVGGKENYKEGPFISHACTVPVSEMRKDPELQSLLDLRGVCRVWMGEDNCMVTYLVNSDHYAVDLIGLRVNAGVSYRHVSSRHVSSLCDWGKLTAVAPIAARYNNYEEKAQCLLQLCTHAVETRHIMQDPLKSWFSKDGHVVLLGDAVHNQNPGTTQGTALAVEDAAVLGSLLSHLRSRKSEEIIRLLSAYQEIREVRCTEITKYQTAVFSTLMYKEGKAFAASSQMKEIGWQKLGDTMLQCTWDEFNRVFGYEAYDAADEWWVDWGAIQERMMVLSADQETALD